MNSKQTSRTSSNMRNKKLVQHLLEEMPSKAKK